MCANDSILVTKSSGRRSAKMELFRVDEWSLGFRSSVESMRSRIDRIPIFVKPHSFFCLKASPVLSHPLSCLCVGVFMLGPSFLFLVLT